MVPARRARLGLELHGRRGADPHVPGLPVRRLQVSARADLDRRRVPAADGARHGVHRSGAALRPGRVLGSRHRRIHRRPRSPGGRAVGPSAARRPDHRGRDALALLRAARVRHSRAADRLRLAAPAPGAEAGHQRVADARTRRPPRHIREGIPRARSERRHAVRAGGGVEGHVLLRRDHRQRHGVRGVSSGRSVRAATRIRRSSRPFPSRTSSSCGSTRCWRCCRPRWKRPCCSSAR